ncbi:MAG: YlbF family regulator [Oscillospiraceae bacterium]|jgi:cell fate (sporulation/competence/biofilm development) regulator YlbF (YheA/YmcA/DUF963 family)|nr:YlbF family regulator [Oscillospiraceae bacterium]
MDVVEITRQLGAVVQKDQRYLEFVEAKNASEADEEVLGLMDKINELREEYQKESEKADADQMLLGKLDQDFQNLYTSLMVNDKMANYEIKRQELDKLMNYLMQILYLCVNGEDPATCEPPQEDEHNCEGAGCASCGGC